MNQEHRRLRSVQRGPSQLTGEISLLTRVSKGDESAVADCLSRYGGLVWSLARRMCPDHETAEDAVQDIFLQVWRSAAKFDAAIASEATFIAMIARRRLIDMSRKKSWKQAQQTKGVDSEQLARLSSSEMGVGRQMEISDEASKALNLLTDLPADQQKVIKLSVYDGMSHSRIAESTGLSLGTVKTHIRRGLLKLREALFSADSSGSMAGGEVRS